MAKRGEYGIGSDQSSRAVDSRRRGYGVMFNPAASRSRLRIVDSGVRYEIRLTDDGRVQYRVEGSAWTDLVPLLDPCNDVVPPPFLSYDERRSGTALESIVFDMIAVGRGRVLAKEAGTDRVFHLVMDELFRTHTADCKHLARGPERTQDPPVPGTYWKLDPEFFTTGAPSIVSPHELVLNYSMHPATMRFRVFHEVLELGVADAMLVLQKPRVWYLIDTRPPLMITGPEDLRITEIAFEQKFAGSEGLDRLRNVIRDSYAAFKEKAAATIAEIVESLTGSFWTTARKRQLGVAIGGALGGIIGAVAGGAIGGPIGALGGAALGAIGGAIVGNFVMPAILDSFIPSMLEGFADALADRIIDELAKRTQESIAAEGFGALVLPANTGVMLAAYGLRQGDAGTRALDTFGGNLCIHPMKAMTKLKETFPENKSLATILAELMRDARGGDPVPNSPPAGVPTYERVRYDRIDGADPREPRTAIHYVRVLDLGVGYSHWSEHWQRSYGTEMNNLVATRPVAQQERYNLLQYRLLNGPVVDADGYNDGTCNFYQLVELGKAEEDRPKYAILWMDEQSYISQRWRLLHPTDDVRGDWFSIQRVLADNVRDHQDFFEFDPARYWSPFDAGFIHEGTRMLVRRQLVVVTGYIERAERHAIFTICFNYGVCDHTWRWRDFPSGDQRMLSDGAIGRAPQPLPKPMEWSGDTVVYVNTLELRDDLVLHVRGKTRVPHHDDLVDARWFQTYLPSSFRQRPRHTRLDGGMPPRGFVHRWHLISEAAFRRADRHYQLGVYDPLTESRCQYYEVELLEGEDGALPPIPSLSRQVWRNDPKSATPPLTINTDNVNLWFSKRSNGYIPLTRANWIEERRHLTMSMYEPTTRFRLLRRAPLGIIAVFFDKRDDELQSASPLPRETDLALDDVEVTDVEAEFVSAFATAGGGRAGGDFEVVGPGPGPHLPPAVPKKIRVIFKAHKQVLRPPVVTRVVVTRRLLGGLTVALQVSFWTPLSVDEVYENIWKMRIAALSDLSADGVVPLFQSFVFEDFVRQGVPDRPLPFDYTATDLGPEHCYTYVWTDLHPLTGLFLATFCTARGRFEFGTSAWFEDVVGHRSTPDILEFDEVVIDPPQPVP